MEYPKEWQEFILKQSKKEALTGFVAGQGNLNAKLMLVGEAPGRVEVATQVPFTGQSGKKLDKWLELAGLKREDLYITSAVRSRPYKTVVREKGNGIKEVVYPNRTPNQREILLHGPLLDYEITQIKPKILAPMGNTGLQRLLGKQVTISASHGQLLKSTIQFFSQENQAFEFSQETYLVFPLYHPAAVLYKPRLEEIIQEDWLKLGSLVNDV